jgi:hypothetical protein
MAAVILFKHLRYYKIRGGGVKISSHSSSKILRSIA